MVDKLGTLIAEIRESFEVQWEPGRSIGPSIQHVELSRLKPFIDRLVEYHTELQSTSTAGGETVTAMPARIIPDYSPEWQERQVIQLTLLVETLREQINLISINYEEINLLREQNAAYKKQLEECMEIINN